MTATFRYRKHQHLITPDEYKQVFNTRCAVSDNYLLVYVGKTELDHARLGLSVSKKRAGIAVNRVRWKRLIREAFRLEQHHIPTGMDLVVLPQVKTPPKFETLHNSLSQLIRRGIRKLGKKSS